MSRATAARAIAILLAAAAGAPIVTEMEGRVLRAYRDPVGIVTACDGDTRDVRMGQVFTDEECDRRLLVALVEHGAQIAPCIKRDLPTPTHGAFLSFAYNVGASQFCGSTLLRKANAGDLRGACSELSKWVYAKGRILPGLVKRRAKERALCERGLAT